MGVATRPAEGIRQGGFVGGAIGFGLGVAGIVVQPVMGTVSLFTDSAKGVYKSVERIFKSGAEQMVPLDIPKGMDLSQFEALDQASQQYSSEDIWKTYHTLEELKRVLVNVDERHGDTPTHNTTAKKGDMYTGVYSGATRGLSVWAQNMREGTTDTHTHTHTKKKTLEVKIDTILEESEYSNCVDNENNCESLKRQIEGTTCETNTTPKFMDTFEEEIHELEIHADEGYHIRWEYRPLDWSWRRKKKAVTGVYSGATRGLSVWAQNMREGIMGVATRPAEGIRQGGFVGGAIGFGLGVAGIVVQPVMGTVSLFTDSAKGVYKSVERIFKSGAEQMVPLDIPKGMDLSQFEALDQASQQYSSEDIWKTYHTLEELKRVLVNVDERHGDTPTHNTTAKKGDMYTGVNSRIKGPTMRTTMRNLVRPTRVANTVSGVCCRRTAKVVE
eukprot:GHVR01080162.1.p1 GENE.GHVR01080162.1~~GHVR01080162.1.p1  ORF type:complete len:451 (+),score=127.69 GHVR01080162.1:26-1354(+)